MFTINFSVMQEISIAKNQNAGTAMKVKELVEFCRK